MSVTNNKIGLGFVGLSAKGGWAAAGHIPAIANLRQYRSTGGGMINIP